VEHPTDSIHSYPPNRRNQNENHTDFDAASADRVRQLWREIHLDFHARILLGVRE